VQRRNALFSVLAFGSVFILCFPFGLAAQSSTCAGNAVTGFDGCRSKTTAARSQPATPQRPNAPKRPVVHRIASDEDDDAAESSSVAKPTSTPTSSVPSTVEPRVFTVRTVTSTAPDPNAQAASQLLDEANQLTSATETRAGDESSSVGAGISSLLAASDTDTSVGQGVNSILSADGEDQTPRNRIFAAAYREVATAASSIRQAAGAVVAKQADDLGDHVFQNLLDHVGVQDSVDVALDDEPSPTLGGWLKDKIADVVQDAVVDRLSDLAVSAGPCGGGMDSGDSALNHAACELTQAALPSTLFKDIASASNIPRGLYDYGSGIVAKGGGVLSLAARDAGLMPADAGAK
jgi:hypothetical protein